MLVMALSSNRFASSHCCDHFCIQNHGLTAQRRINTAISHRPVPPLAAPGAPPSCATRAQRLDQETSHCTSERAFSVFILFWSFVVSD